MQKRVFQLLADNTSGVLSRISGLFSRRGYNIESITAGETADPRFSRVTIVTYGDDEILEQIEKQLAKLEGYADYGHMSKSELYDKIYGKEVEVSLPQAGASAQANGLEP